MVSKCKIILLVIAVIITLSGCATGRKQADLEIQGLKNQVSALETQVQDKDKEILALREALSKTTEDKYAKVKSEEGYTESLETKFRPSVKQIQIALKNAGYNPGAIDGKMGRQTRDAIKAFQRANNLVADGHVGKRTWSLLKEYLDKKVK